MYVQDHGESHIDGIFSEEPPLVDSSKEYALLLPQVDSDGNEIPGVRTPHVQVPLATYTGWNYRPEGNGDKVMAGVIGSYLPFEKTTQERRSNGDSRPSIEERYRTRDDYVAAVKQAAVELVKQRLLLDEDVERYVELARAEATFE